MTQYLSTLFIITAMLVFLLLTNKASAAEDINFRYINSLSNSQNASGLKNTSNDSPISYTDLALLSLTYGKAVEKGLLNQEQYAGTVKALVAKKNSTESPEENAELSSEKLLEDAYTFWALCRASRLSEEPLGTNAAQKAKDILNTKLSQTLEIYSTKAFKENFEVKAPAWLIDLRSDTSSIYVLGLIEYYEKNKDPQTLKIIEALCEGIKTFSKSRLDEFPYGSYYESLENPYIMTPANNRQISALSLAGKLLGNKSFIESAESSADNLYTYLLSSYGPVYLGPTPAIFPQRPENATAITENMINLAQTTGKDNYYILAGLAASWFYGGNTLHKQVYDPVTGKCKTEITEKGLSDAVSLRSSCEALSALTGIYGTKAWTYRNYKEKLTPHCFNVLEAETGKPVTKDYAIEEIVYPGNIKGSLVAIKRENSFWLRFKIDEDNDYSFHLVYLKQDGFATGTSIMMRIDGDKIYSVPLGGSSAGTYMFMQEVLEPRILQTGLHSMGIRFSGLLLRTPARIDCVVLQPLVQRRVFISPEGHNIAIIKNFHDKDIVFHNSVLERDSMLPVSFILKDGTTTKAIGDSFSIKARSYVIVEGQNKK